MNRSPRSHTVFIQTRAIGRLIAQKQDTQIIALLLNSIFKTLVCGLTQQIL